MDKANKDLADVRKITQEVGDKHVTEVEELKKYFFFPYLFMSCCNFCLRAVAFDFQVQNSKQQAEFQARAAQLEATISELRSALSAQTDRFGRLEDKLQAEITHLRSLLAVYFDLFS